MGKNLNEKKQGKSINAFFIVFLVIVFCYFLSIIVPSGEFEREIVDGRTIVVPDSFHSTPKEYLGPEYIFKAIPNGLTSSASMMFVVLIVAGCIEVYQQTGSIDMLIVQLLKKSEKWGSEKILVMIMVMFACLGGFLGWNEQIVPFIPIIISLCLAMGYDVMVGVACSAMIDMISFAVSPSSVYTVGISHEIAELPMFSGFGFRLALLIIFDIIIIAYVLRYARKVKNNPEKSLLYDIDDSKFRIDYTKMLENKMTKNQKIALIVFAGTFIAAIFGVSQKGWSMNDLGAAFLFAGVVGGIICRQSPDNIIDGFVNGAKAGLGPALVIGLARGIQWILTEGHAIDPIINAISKPLGSMGLYGTTLAVMLVISLFNGLIGSGSAKAMALMPILVPLADLVGMNRQIMVLTFQFGDGLTNVLWFTNGTLLTFLSISEIPLNRWYKFIWKLILILLFVAIIALMFAVKINYGPF